MTPRDNATKTSRACERCKSLKIRCLPSSTPGFCEKCLNGGHTTCVLTEPRPRPTRYKKTDAKARIAELEQQLGEVTSKLGSVTNSRANSCPSNTTVETSTENSLSPRLQPYIITPDNRDWVERTLNACNVSYEAAEEHIIRFQAMTTYFPFVALPFDTSYAELVSRSPFLCLSIICAACSQVPHSQIQLESCLRRCLLQQLAIDGERNLDLLQALLVYLGFYHFFSTPKRDQSYMLTALALSVCSDLALDQSPIEALARPIGLRLDHYDPVTQHDQFFSRDARRTYLGCCYIAIHNSMIFGKPATISTNDYMQQCAKSLADGPEFDTDTLIAPLIALQQASYAHHQILATLCDERCGVDDPIDYSMRLGSLENQISTCVISIPQAARGAIILDIATQFARIYAQELDAINPISRRSAPFQNSSSYTRGSSSYQNEILLRCFQAALAMTQAFLTIPTGDYGLLSNLQWSSLILSTVFLYKFCIGLPNVPEWDVHLARSLFDPADFLQLISQRLHTATYAGAIVFERQPPKTLYAMLGLIFEDVRKSWVRERQTPLRSAESGLTKVHATEFSATDIKLNNDRLTGRTCPAKYFWTGQNHALDIDKDVFLQLHESLDQATDLSPDLREVCQGADDGPDRSAELGGIENWWDWDMPSILTSGA